MNIASPAGTIMTSILLIVLTISIIATMDEDSAENLIEVAILVAISVGFIIFAIVRQTSDKKK